MKGQPILGCFFYSKNEKATYWMALSQRYLNMKKINAFVIPDSYVPLLSRNLSTR